MKKTIDKLKYELTVIRTNKVNSSMIENIKVESYGSIVTVRQIAGINILDAKTIEIRPWDASQINIIEKALLKADIGLNSVNNGKLIRVSVSSLTEDRRKDIVKSLNKMAEEFKITIRNERRILIENIKKLEKNKIITKDDKDKFEIEAQKITDIYVKKVSESVAIKQRDIMQI